MEFPSGWLKVRKHSGQQIVIEVSAPETCPLRWIQMGEVTLERCAGTCRFGLGSEPNIFSNEPTLLPF